MEPVLLGPSQPWYTFKVTDYSITWYMVIALLIRGYSITWLQHYVVTALHGYSTYTNIIGHTMCVVMHYMVYQ